MSFIIQPSATGLSFEQRTSNTILTASDSGKTIDITSGSFTQTFNSCANLGSTWFVYLKNSGTGQITLDPSGSETIDGLTSFIMYPNETRLIQSNGTNLFSIVQTGFIATFTASGTFTKPPGYAAFAGLAWGGGASGARTNSAASARGGGGGQCFPFNVNASYFGATETITVGSGGAAYTGTSGSTHNPGGNTSIGSLLTVYGATNNQGAGYGNGAQIPVGFEGQVLTSAAPTLGSIYGGSACANLTDGDSSYSIFGGGAGGCVSATARNGGTSVFGGNGGNGSIASNGINGTAPGGGGGATQTGAQSGAGARGEVRIWGIL